MYRPNIHMPAWTHLHKPDWYALGVRFDHLIHDPRFWATLAFVVLVGLMALTLIFAEPGNPNTFPRSPGSPIYPPYVP